MNYNESYIVKDHFEKIGFNVELECSKSSDYVTISNDNKYGIELTVRFSDHYPMTGRSACADLDYVIPSLKSKFEGKFECNISIDEDGDISSDEVEFDNEEDRDNYMLKVILKEISDNIDF
ncbi:MAG: hypothetical protein ABIL39_11570 [candidate division WOR-3 bacterium]